jgi:hypothetical protein
MLNEIEKPPPGQEDGFSKLPASGDTGSSVFSPPQTGLQVNSCDQAEFDAEITCASMRADELRGCLIREISRTMAIGLQAQAALYDGDDEVALACLRLHWRVTRAGITPLACELAALRRARAVP